MSPSERAVLAALQEAGGEVTVLELLNVTGRSQTLVYQALAALQARGCCQVRSLGAGDRTGGRPRNVYAYRPPMTEGAS